jgi:two-component system, sensor histidine kinase and response regulator
MKMNRFLFAVIMVAVASLLRIWPLHPLGSTLAWLTFYPAVMIAAVYGGFVAGLLVAVLACILITFGWPLLVESPFINQPSDYLGMAVFALTSLMMSGVAEAMLRARIKSKKAFEQVLPAMLAQKDSENLKQAILNSVAAEIAVLDRNGVIVEVNEPWRRFALENGIEPGKPAPRVEVGANYLDVCQVLTDLATERLVDTRKGILAVLDGSLPDFSFEYPCHSPQQQRWFHMNVTPLGKLAEAGVVVTHTDITDRKKAEMALKDSERFMRIIIDNIPGMVGYWTAELRCIFANTAYQTWFGKRPEQMHGIYIEDLLGEELFHKNEPFIRATLRGECQQFERTLVKADGSISYTWTHYIPDLDGDHVRGFFVQVSDITELKQVQIQLELLNKQLGQRTIEAETASRAKSEFVSNMSHEIRTPMNAIIGLSDLALGQDLSPKLRDYLSKIHTSSRALLYIINDILDFSKIESGRLELDFEQFNLEEILKNVSDLFIVRAEEKDIELFFEVLNDVPLMLAGDALRLGQVLNNLVGNAVKFTDTGEVHVKVEQVAEEPGYTTLHFSIRDTGIGISTEQLSYLFEAFTQADRSITRRFGGTGLGLIISKRLVEMMGGNIEVRSEPGKGSTFSFSIRLTVSGQIRPTQNMLRSMRVLVVDDLETSRLILRELLAGWGFQVSEAASGAEALKLLQQATSSEKAFELVLLDWKMPGMDGVEVARQIQAQVAQKRIHTMPVIIMVSALSREELLQHAQGVHLHATLTKPVTASMLCDLITGLQWGSVLDDERETPANLDANEIVAGVRGARILLVEDNVINQQVAQELLESAGFIVDIAHNGQQALDILQREHFDAVLMDLQMPVMDGLTATREIRKNPGLADLPIIAMTAAAMAKDKQASLSAGMNDHVAKPIAPRDLMTILAKWVKTSRQGDSTCKIKMATSRTISLLAELPGFALKDALLRVGGNPALLIKALRQFGEMFAHSAEEMKQLVKLNKRVEAGALAHQLSGVAATLGANELHAAATALEQEATKNQAITSLDLFVRKLSQVLASIAQLPESGPVPGAASDCESCQWKDSIVLFRQLRALLKGNDFIGHELITQLKEAIGCPEVRQDLETLEQHIDKFNYPKALATLDNIKCALGYNLNG